MITGQRLSVEEFLQRWEGSPNLKNAELIDGIVYIPWPVTLAHATLYMGVIFWLGSYRQATQGCQAAKNCTWFMLDSVPQPDMFLRILLSHGGQSGNRGPYASGAPELAVEICQTSTEVDFGPKLALYQRAGVREYITVETLGRRIAWRVLDNGGYVTQQAGADGILRSQIFPGLWLDVAAFWADDGAKMLAALNAGLASEDHQRFVERLAAARKLPQQSSG